MNLTVEQLESAKTAIEGKTTLVAWMSANNISRSEIKPVEVRDQLKSHFGDEVIMTAMRAMFQARAGQQVVMMTSRMLDNPQITSSYCDVIIGHLEEALVLANAKKAELQG